MTSFQEWFQNHANAYMTFKEHVLVVGIAPWVTNLAAMVAAWI
jgi:hypothetical protein